ncbi:MAG: DUF2232 domain-containing protein [Gemmatimonadota bacterium]|nr:DUF2232 domain-containing protein [Gemmatimonadota bacterium]
MSGNRKGTAAIVALLGAALLLSPIGPFPLLAIPFALLLLAFRGREVASLAMAGVILALAFGAGRSEAGWMMERGWGLLSGGMFVALVGLRRPTGLLDRAFAATVLGLGAVLGVTVVRPGFGVAIDGWMAARIREAALAASRLFESGSGTEATGDSIRAAIDAWAAFQHDVYPALLALATMAALAAGWYFVRPAAEGAGRPPAVRAFRFRDEFVWILVAGLALLALPLGAAAFRVGENATVFMTALYLARGGAILGWLAAAAAPSIGTWLLLGVGVVLAYPVVFGAALVVGIGDTWLRVRERLPARGGGGAGR